jgi:hypothetical protein
MKLDADIIPPLSGAETRPHCLKLNLTIDPIIASTRMLPYGRDWKTAGGAYDESTKQARVVRRDTSKASKSEEIREEKHVG